jgi:hypothetical protein
MSESLTPTEGARFLLERDREEDGGSRAVYRTAIYTPHATYVGTATLADDGTATLSDHARSTPGPPPDRPEAGPIKPPETLIEMLLMLAKLTARSAAKKREDGLPPWPARVLRWRGPGRGE